MKIIKQIVNNSFIRNVTLLATGTAAAQFIGLISSPIITRLYGPEAFGIMGAFMAIVQIFIPIAALTYPIAIVLPKDDRNAVKLVKLSFYISLSLSFLIALILLIFNKPIIKMFKIQEVSSYLFLIPIIILFSGIMQICNQWLIRTKQFGINAKVDFFQSIIINSSKIGIGFFKPFASVLVVLSSLANGIRASMMMLFIKRSNYKYSSTNEEKRLSIKEVAKKYLDFPLYRAPEVLINSISQRLPILMLTSLFGPVAAGFYSLGNNVLQQPIRLIGESVGSVFYPRITEAAHNKESLSKLIIKATLALAGVGIIPFGTIIFFGPSIFSFVFGSEWIVAGKYAQWLGLFLFCEFINKPSVRSLPVLSAQLFHLMFTILTLIVRISALVIGYYKFSSDLIAVALFGSSSAIMHILLILLVINKSRTFDKKFVYETICE